MNRKLPILLLSCAVALSLSACSSSAPSGSDVSIPESSPEIVLTSPEVVIPTQTPSPEDNLTTGQKNALRKAESYLSVSAFSANGLIDQLKFEGFTESDAAFAVASCGADWNEQALNKAQNYLSVSAFSYSGLYDQLSFEGFLPQEAQYAIDNCGADWNEQAAQKAQQYMDVSAFSRDGLIDQLKFEGFTAEQAEYGAKAVGY